MFTEEQLENVVIEYFRELGYDYLHGSRLSRDIKEVLLYDRLETSLMKLNKGVSISVIREAIRKIRTFDTNDVFTNNKTFSKYLTETVEVTEFVDGETIFHRVSLLDWNTPENNDFLVVNQLEVIEKGARKIPDVVVYVNGMPLVVLELKSASREEVNIDDAFKQIKNYMNVHIPSLFYYNAFLIISDGVKTEVGTITAPFDRFSAWKKINAEDEIIENRPLDTMMYGLFDKERMLDVIKNFILFTNEAKIMAAYHQYYGMRKAITSTVKATQSDGRAGVIWHTQGSGKSYSMVFLTGNLVKLEQLKNPTIIVITDRNDLDGQLFATFSGASDFIRQTPHQAESRSHIKDLLENRKTGGIVFSTIQKFEDETGLLSERENIIVMVDEAHRTQYGTDAKYDLATGEQKYGYAKYLRDAIPNATFIAFTGTPIESTDKSTTGLFGEVIDVYDMTQAVQDGATVKIFYESRLAKVKLDETQMSEIDKEYWRMQVNEGVEDYVVEESQKHLSRMELIIGDKDRIKQVVTDIIEHYEDRKDLVEGKAMIVAYSRKTAYAMYKEIIEQRPDWGEKVKIVMTANNQDPEELAILVGNKQTRKDRETEFKNVNSPFKIVIVVDMWLTGFDVPSLDTMYVDKPMKAHNLMQAIARVNRVYPGKTGGLVVDYIGLKRNLMEALKTYTSRDQDKVQENEQARDIALNILEVLRNQFHKFNYKEFFGDSDKRRYEVIRDGAEFVQATEKTKSLFLTETKKLKDVYKICTGLLNKQIKEEIAYFIAVRSFIMKSSKTGTPDLKEVNERISKLLENAILEDGVMVLTEATTNESFDLLNEENISKLRAIPQKNIATTILMRVMKEKLQNVKKKNMIVSKSFSDRFEKIIEKYHNRNDHLDVYEVFEELLKFKEELEDAINEGTQLGLSYEEKAFFDVLGSDPDIKSLLQNEILHNIAKDLAKTVKDHRSHDWDKKESAQARMRLYIKKVLRKWDYPPNKEPKAVEDVLEQAKLQAANM
ncbi:HsdR family type I site-specific deoxyribonuclease [Rossellomorea vietnamensis]|uniref:Type I restriction enzyme endonuclease subunit n=1 Tax=Rossellomorea vietnamensis TaxID=218284 RepID=A0A6I6UMR7_9BACI|nr:type I restriction endonuclease subunit R [Rossellomorea vietnamensis]QHE59922.1 HsdR family type I site-specific deoxyribonuclease [Rossellomorea vietnamensis]